MLTDADMQRSMHNCEQVRNARKVAFLQVLPDPNHVDNVQIRIGRNPWRTLHMLDAVVFVRNAFRRQRSKRKKANNV